MRKNFKKLVGTVLATALCVTMVPVQAMATMSTVTSNTNGTEPTMVVKERVNDLELSEEQLQEAYLGNWINNTPDYSDISAKLSLNSLEMVLLEYDSDSLEYKQVTYNYKWKYEGSSIVENLPGEFYFMASEGMEETYLTATAKVLHFSGEYDFYVFRGNMGYGDSLLIQCMDKNTKKIISLNLFYVKQLSEEEIMKYVTEQELEEMEAMKENEWIETEEDYQSALRHMRISEKWMDDVLEAVVRTTKTTQPTEQPKQEEPTTSEIPVQKDTQVEEPTIPETPIPEDKVEEVITDSIYVVKRGDTLSTIATKLYGNNANRYELKKYNKVAFDKTKGKLIAGMELSIPAQLNGQKRLSELVLAEGESIYTVKQGDTLWEIAEKLLGNGNRYKELFTRNGDRIEKATMIFEGQEIVIPKK